MFDPDELPTLLMLGTGDPMHVALQEALGGYATFVEAAASESPVTAVLAAAPDLVVLLGDAAEDANRILVDLRNNSLTSGTPVAVLSEEMGLDSRLDAFEHGAVAVVPKTASLDEMARRLAQLARELPERPSDLTGDLGETTVDELVTILSRELRSGILSVSADGEPQGARIVLRAGKPVSEAIQEFVGKLRPLVEEARPLRFQFQETPKGRINVLDADTQNESAVGVLEGRRILLIDDNPASADALAQELRAHDAKVVVTDGRGAGLERARSLDPEIVMVDEEGLEGWAFAVMGELRQDPQFRWASVLLIQRKELWPADGSPPRMERLAAGVEPLLEPERDLIRRVGTGAPFETRLEGIGPRRLLRALVRTGATLHVTVRNRRAIVEIDVASGLVAGAEATQTGSASQSLAGPVALSALLVLGSGRVRIEHRANPTCANVLAPVDDALAAATREPAPIRPSLPPPPSAGLAARGAPLSPEPDAVTFKPPRPGKLLPPEEAGGGAKPLPAKPAVAYRPPPPKPKGLPPKPKTKLARGKLGAPSAAVRSALAAPPSEPPAAPSAPPVRSSQAAPGGEPSVPEKPSEEAPKASKAVEAAEASKAAKASKASKAAGRKPKQEPARLRSGGSLLGPAIVTPSAQSGEDTLRALEAARAAESIELLAPPIISPEISRANASGPAALPEPGSSRAGLEEEDLFGGVGDSLGAEIDSAPIDAAEIGGESFSPAGDLTTASRPAIAADFPRLPRPQGNRMLLLGGLGVGIALGVLVAYLLFADHGPGEAGGSAPLAVAADAAAGPMAAGPAVVPAAADAGAAGPAVAEPDAAGPAPEAAADAGLAIPAPTPDPDAGSSDGDVEGAATDEEEEGSGESQQDVSPDFENDESLSREERVERLIDAGNFQRGQGHLRTAQARYEAALRLSPNNGRAMAGLVRTHIERHRFEEAIALGRQLVRAHPSQAGNRVLLGDALRANGQLDRAQRAWRAALSINPNHRGARRRLGMH